MKVGETKRMRAITKVGGTFPVYADVRRDALGRYTVTVDNEDCPGVLLSSTEIAHDKPHFDASFSGPRVFQADSEEEARAIAKNEIDMQMDLLARYNEEFGIVNPTVLEFLDGKHPDWIPAGLDGRLKDVGPSLALAEEFGLDYRVALIDIDFGGQPLIGQNYGILTLDPLDVDELSGMDTTPISTFFLPPERGRAMMVAVLSHAGEAQRASSAWSKGEVRVSTGTQVRAYHVAGFGFTAFAVREATPEEIADALPSKPAIMPNRAARRRAKHGRK